MSYGLIGKLTAHRGKRDDLVTFLARAAELLEGDQDCVHYLISTSDEPDAVWVTETWTSKEAHDASLRVEAIRALISQAMPLVASVTAGTELQVVAGKGL